MNRSQRKNMEKVWYLGVLFYHTESIFPLLVLCSRRYQLVNIQESTGINAQLHEKKKMVC